MSKLGIKEVAERVAEKTGKSVKLSKDVINATLETIQEELAEGNDVAFVGYVSFNVEEVAARSGSCAGRKWSKPAHSVVKAKLGAKLKNAVEE
jgi:DNA-binding protein HU-beta